jgi:hypothetical protein
VDGKSEKCGGGGPEEEDLEKVKEKIDSDDVPGPNFKRFSRRVHGAEYHENGKLSENELICKCFKTKLNSDLLNETIRFVN